MSYSGPMRHDGDEKIYQSYLDEMCGGTPPNENPTGFDHVAVALHWGVYQGFYKGALAQDVAQPLVEQLNKWEKRKERVQRWIEGEQASTGKTVVNGDTVWRMLEGYLS